MRESSLLPFGDVDISLNLSQNVPLEKVNEKFFHLEGMRKRKSLDLRRKERTFNWKTRAIRSGLSEAVCPGRRFSSISLHFGLQVKVRKMSGFPYLATMDIAS